MDSAGQVKALTSIILMKEPGSIGVVFTSTAALSVQMTYLVSGST